MYATFLKINLDKTVSEYPCSAVTMEPAHKQYKNLKL